MAAPGPIRAYQGDEPYLFVGYSHDDAPVAHAALAELDRYGYRVWYDEGITPSRDWADVIARKIRDCAAFVVLLSKNAVTSDDVKNEIHFALEERKQFLANFLAETVLSDGLRLQLSRKQAIFRYELEPTVYETKIRESLPTKALRPAATKAPEQDEVCITIFAPARVKRDEAWVAQAWVRAANAVEDLLELAREFDASTERLATVTSGVVIHGTRIGFELKMDGSRASCKRERVWNGWADMAPLRVETTDLAEHRAHRGQFTVLLDGLPVTRLDLSLQLGDTATRAAADLSVEARAKTDRVFLCYAAQDREAVAHYAQLLRGAGADTFMDVTSLAPGSRWDEALTRAITDSDIFMLFWSRSAAQSKWVEREWRHALSLGREGFVRPVLLEMAPIPSELQHIHFQRLALGK